MRARQLVALTSVAFAAAACGGTSNQAGSSLQATQGATPGTTSAVGHSDSTPTTCRTSALKVSLGAAGGAAGSMYRPIVFTNTGTDTCTLFGYPGVAFVAPDTGHQVGAAATRNPQHASTTVTLAAGAKASAMLQIVDAHNYPASSCDLTPVSGLRVYPPGETTAASVAFGTSASACSTKVNQLTVEAVVPGRTGA